MTEDRRQTEVRAVLAEMAGRIAAAAPRGWKRAELHGYATGPVAAGHHGFRFEPDELNGYRANDADVFDDMRDLHAVVGAVGHLTIELEVEAGGRYRAVVSERLDRVGNRCFRYLLDPRSVPPEPGEFYPDPTAREAGDPGEAVVLLHDYLRRLDDTRPPGRYRDLPGPLSRGRRLQIAAGLDFALPRDLAAMYGVLDGDGDGDDGRGLFLGYTWFDLETLAESCRAEERWWFTPGWRGYEFRPLMLVKEFGPPLTIRRLTDHPAWIPFATDTGGNYLAVDMAPGPRGRRGQVILIGRDHCEGPTYVADSVTSLLRSQVQALAAGSFEHDDDGVGINVLDLRRYENSYGETAVLRVAGPEAAPVRGMNPDIRELTVSNAPWVDLGPVRGAPALWQVSMRNCPGADLSPLRDTPVEVLDIEMDTIDLTDLEGHPTLQRVVLHSERPVDLRPLLSCPRLYALDLTDATAVDLSAVGGAAGLRYLKMRRAGWKELLRAKAVPASLAVGELAEEESAVRRLYWSFDKATKAPRPTLRDAVDWARHLGADSADIRTFSGRAGALRRH